MSENMIDQIVSIIERHGFAADSDTWEAIGAAIKTRLTKKHPYHVRWREFWEHSIVDIRGYNHVDDNRRFDTAKEAYEHGRTYFSKTIATKPLLELNFYIMQNNNPGHTMVFPWGDVLWIPVVQKEKGYHGSIDVIKLTDGLMYQCKHEKYSFLEAIGTAFYNNITPELYKEQTGRDLQTDIDKHLEDAPGSFANWNKGTWRLKNR